MSAGPIVGNFTVVDSNNKVVCSGLPVAMSGAWGEWDHIYSADFKVSAVGTCP